MALFNYEFNTLNDLFVQQLQDIYDAEQRLTSALPQMAEAAHSSVLASAFRSHEQQTQQQIKRLEQIFQRLNCEPERETSDAMKGLIDDGQKMAKASGDAAVCDAALIAAAQRVEHYEIASYGTARTFAQQLGMPEIARMLQQTLDEEGQTDKRLTQIAESSINVQSPQQ